MQTITRIKEQFGRAKDSPVFPVRFVVGILRKLYHALKFLFDNEFRQVSLSRIKYRKKFHQIHHTTAINRYPDLFSICKEYFADFPVVSVLSFGCSTGEEVWSIGSYLPQAKIVGVDISEWCIAMCKERFKDDRFTFLHTLSPQLQDMSGFNLVLALAVFQHPDNRVPNVRYARSYQFSRFEEQILLLDKKLATGGLMIIDNCDFDFGESAIAEKYAPLEHPMNRLETDRPLFNRQNIKVSEASDVFRVYRKTGN